MSRVGIIEALWRYPVKSMRGEALDEAFVGFGGVRGDRLFAFESSAARPDFPYFTARQQNDMLRYRPHSPNERSIQVETPYGETLAIDDPRLIDALRRGVDPQHRLRLLRSERALADCHPVSLISLQTVQQLAQESQAPAEKRRFRANVYLDLQAADGFAEDEFVGRSLRLGSQAVVSIVKRDGRCMMINLDPDTAAATPAVLKQVAQKHDGKAGIYACVLVEGVVRKGDSVELLALERDPQ